MRRFFANAWLGLRAPFLPFRAGPLTYAESMPLGIIGILLLITAIPDAFLHHLFLPHSTTLALAFDALELYAALWVLGFYGSMLRRPHELSAERLIVRMGNLPSKEVALKNICAVRAHEKKAALVLELHDPPGKRIIVRSDRPAELLNLITQAG